MAYSSDELRVGKILLILPYRKTSSGSFPCRIKIQVTTKSICHSCCSTTLRLHSRIVHGTGEIVFPFTEKSVDCPTLDSQYRAVAVMLQKAGTKDTADTTRRKPGWFIETTAPTVLDKTNTSTVLTRQHCHWGSYPSSSCVLCCTLFNLRPCQKLAHRHRLASVLPHVKILQMMFQSGATGIKGDVRFIKRFHVPSSKVA